MQSCPVCKATLVGVTRKSVYGTETTFRCYCGYKQITFLPSRKEERNG